MDILFSKIVAFFIGKDQLYLLLMYLNSKIVFPLQKGIIYFLLQDPDLQAILIQCMLCCTSSNVSLKFSVGRRCRSLTLSYDIVFPKRNPINYYLNFECFTAVQNPDVLQHTASLILCNLALIIHFKRYFKKVKIRLFIIGQLVLPHNYDYYE